LFDLESLAVGVEKKEPRRVHKSKLSTAKEKLLPENEQEEFTFVEADAQRGYFGDSERNIFDGQDLDIPTYLRQGIKIVL